MFILFGSVQLTWTARMALTVADIQPAGEVVVSYLPLSHVAAQMFDMWMCASLGLTTYFADPDALKVGERPDLVVLRKPGLFSGPEPPCVPLLQGSLVNTLKEARPTLFMGVPRVWEKMQEKMRAIGAKASPMRKAVADWAKSIGLQYNYSRMNG